MRPFINKGKKVREINLEAFNIFCNLSGDAKEF